MPLSKEMNALEGARKQLKLRSGAAVPGPEQAAFEAIMGGGPVEEEPAIPAMRRGLEQGPPPQEQEADPLMAFLKRSGIFEGLDKFAKWASYHETPEEKEAAKMLARAYMEKPPFYGGSNPTHDPMIEQAYAGIAAGKRPY